MNVCMTHGSNEVRFVPPQILGVPKVGQILVADLALQNPLPEPLENCVFTIHGANLTDGKPITHE